MFKLPNWSICTYVSFPITFSGIFHWAGVYQWFPVNPLMKCVLQENRNLKNKKYEWEKKHRPFRNAQYFCCSWWRKEKNIYEAEFEENWLKNSHASPTNANETDGNLIVPNPSMFMVQLITLTFVIDFFVVHVSCKCMKPSFTRNSWLQSQEYKWCEEFVVPFIPIHFGNGCFFTTTCFRFHQNQHWTYLLFFPIPSKSVKFLFLVSLTCHFKSC